VVENRLAGICTSTSKGPHESSSLGAEKWD